MRNEISFVKILQNDKLHVHTDSADDERCIAKADWLQCTDYT